MKRLRNVVAIVAVIISWSSIGNAADPVLYFSDITSGPKKGLGDGLGSGAIVSIWGVNLGASQGESTILANGVPPAHVYYWGNATPSKLAGPSDLYTYHRMQTISFSVAARATDGAGTISVTVGGVASNPLPFTVRTGNIVHIKTNGTDNSTCGPWDTPCRSFTYAQTRTAAGDIMYMGDGVVETDSVGFGCRWMSKQGTRENPFALVAYPGAEATCLGKGSQQVDRYIPLSAVTPHNKASWNLVHSKLKLITDSGNFFGRNARIIANEITDKVCAGENGQSGAICPQGPPNNGGETALGNYVHDYGGECTSTYHHTTYIGARANGGAQAEAFEFGWNVFLNNWARGGFHFYEEYPCLGFTTTTRIHDNYMDGQASNCINIASGSCYGYDYTGPGVLPPANPDLGYFFRGEIEIYNNVLKNCGLAGLVGDTTGPAIRIVGDRTLTNVKIYNNTIYAYGDPNTSHDPGLFVPVFVHPNYGGTWEWKNNIVYDTKDRPFTWGTSIFQQKPPVAASNNIWYNGGDGNPVALPSWDTVPITTDPILADPMGGDFRIPLRSPARDTGNSSVGNVVKRDFLGVDRSKCGTIDIGAFENPSPPDIR